MNAVKRIFTVLLSVAALSALSAQAGQKQIVRTGIEVLEGRGFEGLVGKNVGLVTNPSGIDHNLRSTIDILHEAPGVNLKALFAPEHGVRGDAYAGSHVEDFKDPKTGIPVYSIYGSNRKPSKKMLEGWTSLSMTSRTSAAVPILSSAPSVSLCAPAPRTASR